MKISRILICLLFAGTVFAQSGQKQEPMHFCVEGDPNCSYIYSLIVPANPAYTDTAVMVLADKGPTVEIISREHGKAVEILRIKDADGKMLITVHMDGSVTTDNGYKADDAAKSFWRALAAYYRPVCDQMYPPATTGKP